MTLRNKGLEVNHTYRFDPIQSLSPHAHDKLFQPKEKRMCVSLVCVYAWCWVWCLDTHMVARQISSIHDAQTFASNAQLDSGICWCLKASVQCYAACLPLFRCHPVSIHWKLTVAMIQFSCLKLIDIIEKTQKKWHFLLNHFLYSVYRKRQFNIHICSKHVLSLTLFRLDVLVWLYLHCISCLYGHVLPLND